MSPEPKKMELTYFERNAGVRIGVLKDGETPVRVRIAIPFELEGRAGEFDLDFSTVTGIDAFVRDLQIAREMVHGPYGHIPAHCTHCGSEISRQDPAGVREHVMTCEKNPLVVLLGQKARRLVEVQEAYEHMVDLRRRDVQKLGGLEAQLVDALPTEDERQVLRWVREVLQQQSPTAHADIRYGAALELLQRLLVLRMNCAA